MTDLPTKIHTQSTAYDSPWSARERVGQLLWGLCWALFCSWTPKPLNPWRLFWLKCFGGTVYGRPFVHQRARIQIPWNLTLHDRACLGDRTNVYALGPIEILPRATIAQEAYLCNGSHDFTKRHIPLVTSRITIGADAFIGARAFVLMGITIGEGTVVGACSVVTRDLPPWTICAGNPCRALRPRLLE
ncbi:DapH/DapD/GlmU-related protein [Anthocerotibacter panamensis]|uniref:DapH/DapD/GlmU-related protein n=1 Tax=Anthocerotibacter panamensis TaxID=2857077 RepID=UPI001C407352|nr:DapH/DapD/GlmU-related protein [Anthocerotibacter panamensis]